MQVQCWNVLMKILQASIWMLDLRVKERLIECLKIQDKEHRGEPFETLNIWNAIVTEQLKELLNRACEVQRVAGAWAALIAGPTVMSAIDIVYETEVDEFDNEELYTQGAYFILRAIMKMHGTEI